jgi:hypothetical protein
MTTKLSTKSVKFAALAMTATALIFTMVACGGSTANNGNGGGGTSRATIIAEGNWSLVGASTTMPGSKYSIGGHIKQTGSALSGNVGMAGPCDFPQSFQGSTVAITGSISGNQLTFAFGPTASGSMVHGTLTGTGASLQTLTGSFTVTGGCASGDQVTTTATLLPPLSGTWTGTGSATTGEPNVGVSVTFAQQATPNNDGTYFISGTLNYNSSTCAANGVELDGEVAGSIAYLTFNEANADPVWFSFIGSFDNPPSASTITGTYQTSSGFTTIPGCVGDSGTIQFTKK